VSIGADTKHVISVSHEAKTHVGSPATCQSIKVYQTRNGPHAQTLECFKISIATAMCRSLTHLPIHRPPGHPRALQQVGAQMRCYPAAPVLDDSTLYSGCDGHRRPRVALRVVVRGGLVEQHAWDPVPLPTFHVRILGHAIARIRLRRRGAVFATHGAAARLTVLRGKLLPLAVLSGAFER
jgi:hypothetical protein